MCKSYRVKIPNAPIQEEALDRGKGVRSNAESKGSPKSNSPAKLGVNLW